MNFFAASEQYYKRRIIRCNLADLTIIIYNSIQHLYFQEKYYYAQFHVVTNSIKGTNTEFQLLWREVSTGTDTQ